VYERFTSDAKAAVAGAEQAARLLAHATVGPEHLLLGLAGAPGTAARVLAGLGLDEERAAQEVERLVPRGARASSGSLPFTPRARGVLEGALRQAMSLGHDVVGTEHLLLALTADGGGVAGRVLETVAHPGVVRDAVLQGLDEAPAEAVDAVTSPAIAAVPDAVSVRIGDDVRALLRRAAGAALADDVPEVTVDHVRRALDGTP
jgi:ATP-dependent Clp protease ATP-binding subunit ClpC